MSDGATLTVTIPSEIAGKLADFAKRDNSTADRVVAKALEDYLNREGAIVTAIAQGRADLRAGRVFTQQDVVREVQRTIDAARS